MRVLALHGFGGTFGSKAGTDAVSNLAAELQARGLKVEFVTPSAPNKVGDNQAWLAGDQEPLGRYVGFLATDRRLEAEGNEDLEPQPWSVADLPPPLTAEDSIWKGSEGADRSLSALEAEWEAGHFDGVLGFSQGGLTASLLCAHLQANRPDLPQPRFAITCGSFAKPYPAEVAAFWPPASPLQVPSLHSLGELDTIVAPFRSEELSAQFATPRVYRHWLVGQPRGFGGHVVPWDTEAAGPGCCFADAVAELLRATGSSATVETQGAAEKSTVSDSSPTTNLVAS